MTTNITELASQMRGLAEAATPGPHHIYTHPRDDNNYKANEAWHAACEPQAIITILDALEAAQAEVARLNTSLVCVRKDRDDNDAAFKYWCNKSHGQANELNAALARLAEIEAGASPVQPSQAGEPTSEQVESAAMKLSECFDYPWDSMPHQGRENMRKHAKSVIAAINAKGAGK